MIRVLREVSAESDRILLLLQGHDIKAVLEAESGQLRRTEDEIDVIPLFGGRGEELGEECDAVKCEMT